MACEIKGRFCRFSRYRNISTQCAGGGCGTCLSIIFLTGITARRCHHSQVRTVPWTTFFNGDEPANKRTAATLLSGTIAWPVSMPHRRTNVRDRFLAVPQPPSAGGSHDVISHSHVITPYDPLCQQRQCRASGHEVEPTFVGPARIREISPTYAGVSLPVASYTHPACVSGTQKATLKGGFCVSYQGLTIWLRG